MSVSSAKILSTESLASTDAKWLSLSQTTWRDPSGQTRHWEHAERITRPDNSSIDSVGILAIFINAPAHPSSSLSSPAPPHAASLLPPTEPSLLLLRQFRPPARGVCIEVPAGLIDARDASPAAAALRELREETGYVGVVDTDPAWAASPVLFPDPGLTGTSTVMVHVTIDLADPRNAAPAPRRDEGEFVDAFAVPLRALWDECRRLERDEGARIDGRVGSLAEGVELARRWALWAAQPPAPAAG